MNSTCSRDQCDACPARVVCRCLQVTEDEIVSVIETLGLRTVQEVRQATGAGTGCTCCHTEIRQRLAMVDTLAIAG